MIAIHPLRAAACAAVALLAAGCATAHAPPAAPIATSRLGITRSTGTVPAGVVQLEAGYSRARLDQRTRHAFGETLVRVGLDARTELRGSVPSYMRTVTPATTMQGMGDAALSVKHRLRDPAGWVPAVALTAGATLPTGAKGVGAGDFQPEGAVSAEWELPRGLRALGMATWRDAVVSGDRHGMATLSAAGRTSIGSAAAGQLEYARTTSTRAGAADVSQLRATAALRLGPNLQLDGWAGRATSAGKHEYLLGIGFARRW
ncbi:transporter [Longimicrobium sp.]|uniref:transporter n=1 Tax=Longimicrobium sp. TaxID=2029185 RepID=UPI002C19B552|nr:transporter [Longimicrobium sp.]HSU13800.1 transporter [Longimicrobium sp.]